MQANFHLQFWKPSYEGQQATGVEGHVVYPQEGKAEEPTCWIKIRVGDDDVVVFLSEEQAYELSCQMYHAYQMIHDAKLP